MYINRALNFIDDVSCSSCKFCFIVTASILCLDFREALIKCVSLYMYMYVPVCFQHIYLF